MQPDSSYVQRAPGDEAALTCQETLMGVAERRLSAAEKHREKKVRSQLVNHFRRRLEGNR